ncbi:hypothetical protein GF325_01940 [Candidatus Bathyarchaeota archaeon]|nr:hypothetical protein [Candidatus Bathyarchaeota archaeon]
MNERKLKIVLLAAIFLIPMVHVTSHAPCSGAILPREGFDGDGAIPIMDQFCISHGNSRDPRLADFVEGFGCKINRNNIMWYEAEKENGHNNYTWDYYDNLYSNDSARGIESLGLFVFGRDGWPDSNYVSPGEWDDWEMFVTAFVNRYKENLTYYEMWNEPDIGFWSGTDEEFFVFLNKTTRLVRSLDNDCIIVSPGVSGPNVEYMEKMVNFFGDEQFNELFDIMAFHAYPNRNGEHLSYRISQVQDMARRHGFDGPFWITEVGFTTSVDTEEQLENYLDELMDYQATQVLKHYCQCIDANLSSVFWYDLTDWCGNPYYGEEWFGLITCDFWDSANARWEYKYKPAGHAYKRMNELLQDGTYYPGGELVKAPNPSEIWSYYFLTHDGKVILVAWSRGTASQAKVYLHAPPGHPKPEFDLRDYWYAGYRSDYHENLTSHSFPIGNRPVLLEIDYSDYMNAEGLSLVPLTLVLDVSHDPLSIAFMVGIPSLVAISLLHAINQSRPSLGKKQRRVQPS